MPESGSGTQTDVATAVRWPIFLLANQIYLALGHANEKTVRNDKALRDRICEDKFMLSAVEEAYTSLRNLLYQMLQHQQCRDEYK
jgi:callose synthase